MSSCSPRGTSTNTTIADELGSTSLNGQLTRASQTFPKLPSVTDGLWPTSVVVCWREQLFMVARVSIISIGDADVMFGVRTRIRQHVIEVNIVDTRIFGPLDVRPWLSGPASHRGYQDAGGNDDEQSCNSLVHDLRLLEGRPSLLPAPGRTLATGGGCHGAGCRSCGSRLPGAHCQQDNEVRIPGLELRRLSPSSLHVRPGSLSVCHDLL